MRDIAQGLHAVPREVLLLGVGEDVDRDGVGAAVVRTDEKMLKMYKNV